MKYFKHSLLMLLLCLSVNMFSQTEAAQWSFGLSYGKMEYTGSVGNNVIYESPFKAAYGARLSKYLSPLFDVSLSASLGKHGLYDSSDNPNSFEGSVFQSNLAFHFKPVSSEKLQPFFSAGIGYFNYNDDSPDSVIAKGDNSSGMTIPLGAGLKYHISDGFGLFYQTQFAVDYRGDAYNGVDAGSNDRYWLHELGIAFNFGMEDRDGDRVADEKDECPDTPGLRKLKGCPDTDMDGIPDKDDECPEDPGLMEYNGCPDTDMDGIIDKNDLCPNVKGEERFSGCPDTDGDGIGDGTDECVDVAGLERYNGCPIPDTDGDGFNDEEDVCPKVSGEFEGCPDSDGDGFHDGNDDCVNEAGTVQGCPDADSDGIADKDDECPDEAGIPEKNGCPEIPTPTREEIINSWRGPNIQFVSGTRPDENYDSDLEKIKAFHDQYPDAYIHLGGYSDCTGSESSNMRISERRAKKVYNDLIEAGIPAEQMTYEAYGEANPVADNDTREGQLKNRRVEVSASTVKREIETKNVKR